MGKNEEASCGKKSKKRPKSSSTIDSPESKKRKKKDQKLIKQKAKNHSFFQQDDTDQIKVLPSKKKKEGYESHCPTEKMNGGKDIEQNKFAEPEIVFKKVFTPDESKSDLDGKTPDQLKKDVEKDAVSPPSIKKKNLNEAT